MKYIYFATFDFKDDLIEISFPDLYPNASTYGHDLQEALRMAKDSLEGYLLTVEDFKENLPSPSSYQSLLKNSHLPLFPIEVDTTIAREKELNKTIKKTLTIPKYLNDLGNDHGINFSSTLTNALKEKLNV